MTETVARLIGVRVKYFRDLRGLTQQQLADLSGTSIATVNRIENGEQNFSFDRLVAIAEALDIQVSDCFETIDDPVLSLVVRLLNGLSMADRGDILFILGKFLEGKTDSRTVALLNRASGLRCDHEMAS